MRGTVTRRNSLREREEFAQTQQVPVLINDWEDTGIQPQPGVPEEEMVSILVQPGTYRFSPNTIVSSQPFMRFTDLSTGSVFNAYLYTPFTIRIPQHIVFGVWEKGALQYTPDLIYEDTAMRITGVTALQTNWPTVPQVTHAKMLYSTALGVTVLAQETALAYGPVETPAGLFYAVYYRARL